MGGRAEQDKGCQTHAWQGREKTLGTKIKNNYINYIRKSSKHPDKSLACRSCTLCRQSWRSAEQRRKVKAQDSSSSLKTRALRRFRIFQSKAVRFLTLMEVAAAKSRLSVALQRNIRAGLHLLVIIHSRHNHHNLKSSCEFPKMQDAKTTRGDRSS